MKFSKYIFPFLLPAAVAFSAPDFNGAAIVNGCSGGMFIMDGMRLDQKALLITNGHCVHLRSLVGGPSDYPSPGEVIYDIEGARVSGSTAVSLHSDAGSFPVRASKLFFATMTGTDVAVYELEMTYQQLKLQYGLEPLILDKTRFQQGNPVLIHAAYFNRTQTCAVDGFADLREGPYKTRQGIRLTRECDIYVGYSGSPILRPDARTFSGLANTHFDAQSSGEICGFNKPCEYNESTGEKVIPKAGQSYGVPTDFLYDCFEKAEGKINFNLDTCPYKRATPNRSPASFGSEVVPSGDPLESVLVAIGNEKSQFCTGSFVAKDVVLTAAHCVIPDEKGNAIGKVGDYVYPLSLQEGFDPIRGDKIRIEKVSLHPDKDKLDVWIKIGESDQYPFDNPDMALLKLSRPYPNAKPAKISDVASQPGDRLSFSGFGRGNQNWQRPGRLRFTVLKGDYSTIGSDFSDLTEGNTYEFMKAFGSQFDSIAPFFTFVRPQFPGLETLCYGDSGGPLYMMNKGQMTIFGVASLYMPHPNKGNPSCGDSYLNVFAKVSPHFNWLRNEIVALTNKVEE